MYPASRRVQIMLGPLFEPPIRLTKTPPQRDYFVMTRVAVRGYSRTMTQGLRSADAFLVQFRRATGSSADRLSGRVEHVASGYTAMFTSVEELPKLLASMLKSVASAANG